MKIVPYRVKIFLCVQRTVFTHSVLEQTAEQSIGWQSQLSITLSHRCCMSLKIVLNSFVQLEQQAIGIGRSKSIEMMLCGRGFCQQVTRIGAISCDLPCSNNQARNNIATAAYASRISPGIGCVAGMDTIANSSLKIRTAAGSAIRSAYNRGVRKCNFGWRLSRLSVVKESSMSAYLSLVSHCSCPGIIM